MKILRKYFVWLGVGIVVGSVARIAPMDLRYGMQWRRGYYWLLSQDADRIADVWATVYPYWLDVTAVTLSSVFVTLIRQDRSIIKNLLLSIGFIIPAWAEAFYNSSGNGIMDIVQSAGFMRMILWSAIMLGISIGTAYAVRMLAKKGGDQISPSNRSIDTT